MSDRDSEIPEKMGLNKIQTTKRKCIKFALIIFYIVTA